jgi:hypothetical protein
VIQIVVPVLLVVVWPLLDLEGAHWPLRVAMQATDDARPTDEAEDEAPAENRAAVERATEPSEVATLPGPLLIVGGALVAGLVLLVLLWVILCGGSGRKPVKS